MTLFYVGWWEEMYRNFNPDYDDSAVSALNSGKMPTIEEREKYQDQDAARFKFEYDLLTGAMGDEEFEFVDMPQAHIDHKYGVPWLGRTPSRIQRVIEAIDECWVFIRDLGYMPDSKEPDPSMTDDEVTKAINELNYMLKDEGVWRSAVGYGDLPLFLGEDGADLDMKDKRTIIAVIQKAIQDSGVRDIVKEGL